MIVDGRIWGSRHRIALPVVAVATCVGYYLGSLIGFQLTIPPATTSVLWPPNAILTSVLVLTNPRRWPFVLLPVLPVHLLIQHGTGWPIPLILALFVTNCLEAILAAGGMHLLSDTPWRFDSLRSLAVFFFAAVVMAPGLSSFADAAVVHWFRNEPYWLVWGNRFVGNLLAELTVVPAVVGGTLGFVRWWRRGMMTPSVEPVVLALGLTGIGWVNFTHSLDWYPSLRAMSSQTPLAVELPFLLWAAMRFGPTGTGLSVLVASILSAWTVVQGHGPFASISPTTTVTALTLSLIVVAATLMCLATLIEERRQTQHALRIRLEFESLLARLSSTLVQEPSDYMHRAFEAWLGRIGRVLEIDCVTVFTASGTPAVLSPAYTWMDDWALAVAAEVEAQHRAWANRTMSLQDGVLSTNEESVKAAAEGRSLPGVESRSGGAIPLVGEGHLLGALAFSCSQDPILPATLPGNLWLVADVLAGALRRKQSEDALVTSEVTKSAILQSLDNGVAVVDRAGAVLHVNARWGHEVRGCEWLGMAVGDNLIDVCRRSAASRQNLAREIAVGVASVLDGSRERFLLEHMIDAGAVPRWWSLSAVPLNRSEGGAVLVCADMTDLRRAEMEAQRSRQELAHVGRVSTIGEMTASLAHQLNQPLAAIMTNAQAAGRMLNTAAPNVAEVRAILQDIVKDDRRASDVIQRLRQILRNGELEIVEVNLTAAIREVVDLVGTETKGRNVAVSYDFDAEPIVVKGDRVQLQQVILNLLHNAMDAVADEPSHVGRIVIGVRANREAVIVSVRDSGPGLPAGTEEMVFEPFYTTKARGMGMGLSIVRSIVEAHGGTIRASNAIGRGALIEFQLPRTEGIAAA